MISPSKPTATSAPTVTGWTLLAMLSLEEEASGYELKKWIDWGIDLYYGSPASSQIYTELKKLEGLGLVASRIDRAEDPRSRRLYRITTAGIAAVTDWANTAPIDPPVVKNSALLRVTFGHLSSSAKLKDLLQEHLRDVEARYHKAMADAEDAAGEPAWAYSVLALRWAAKYYEAQREFALELMKDLDEADEIVANAVKDGTGIPRGKPGYWREIRRH